MPRRGWLLACAGGLACLELAALADVALRARWAYYEGEKYMAWNADPSRKRAALDAALFERQQRLRRQAAREGWTPQALALGLDLCEFERDERMKESSLKYAYLSYQTAIALFSPPESPWVKRCRAKAPRAKRLWERELKARGVRYKGPQVE